MHRHHLSTWSILVGCPSRSTPPAVAATPVQQTSFIASTPHQQPATHRERVPAADHQLPVLPWRHHRQRGEVRSLAGGGQAAVAKKMCNRIKIPPADQSVVSAYLLAVSR
jgi:hypothetical protein